MDISNHEGLSRIAKIREQCDYLEEHFKNIAWAWKVLQEKCKDMQFIWDDYLWATIDGMVKEHDLSKFSKEEFIPYCNRFFPVHAGDKDDPVVKAEFNTAWKHHKEHNPHHWQNWASKKYYNPHEAECHCVCMVVDWMAMGKKVGDTAPEYYERNKDKINLPEWAVKFIMEIFVHT